MAFLGAASWPNSFACVAVQLSVMREGSATELPQLLCTWVLCVAGGREEMVGGRRSRRSQWVLSASSGTVDVLRGRIIQRITLDWRRGWIFWLVRSVRRALMVEVGLRERRRRWQTGMMMRWIWMGGIGR